MSDISSLNDEILLAKLRFIDFGAMSGTGDSGSGSQEE